MPNLANAPTFRIAERREILQRVYTALVMDQDCRIPVIHGGYQELTEAETANWEARQTVVSLMKEVCR